MQFDDIVSDVCGRLSLTAAAAVTRVGQRVNRRYARVTSSIGLAAVFRREQLSFTLSTGTRIQTIQGFEKILSISDPNQNADRPPLLEEITYDEMLERLPNTSAPTAWAVKRSGARQVTILIDYTDTSGTYAVSVEGEENASVLAGSNEPAFPESFHDVLVFGALADEYAKMEKVALKRESEAEYERILSELRLHIAVSGFLDIVQGKKKLAATQVSLPAVSAAAAVTTSDDDDDTLEDAFNFLNVKDFGARGDGTTDDTADIQECIDQAILTGRAIILFPAGNYRLAGSLYALGASNIQFWGEDRSNTKLVWDDTALPHGLLIDTLTNAATSTTLNGTPAIGAHALTVVDATGFTAGKFAFIQHDSVLTEGTMLSNIVSASGTTITLDEGLSVPLTSGATVRQYDHDLLEGVIVRNLTFSCVNGRSTALMPTLLFLSRIHDVVVKNCTFNGSVGPLITTRTLKGGVIKDCQFRNALTIAGSAIEVQSSTGLKVSDCKALFTRFGYVFTGSPHSLLVSCTFSGAYDATNTGRGGKFQNSSNYSIATACSFSDCSLTGFRVESASHCSINNCNVSFHSDGENGAGGVQLGGTASLTLHNTIDGCTILGGGANAAGIVLVYDVANVDGFHVITNNNIAGCNRYGVYAAGRHNTIHNNNVGSADTGAIIYVPANSGYDSIDGNTLTREGGSTPAAIHTVDGVGFNHIGALNIYTEATLANLHAADVLVNIRDFIDNTGSDTAKHTAADLVAVNCFTKSVAAGTFTASYQAARMFASGTFGATANNKKVILTVGTQVLTVTLGDNNTNWHLIADLMYVTGGGGSVYVDLHFLHDTAVYVTAATSLDGWDANPITVKIDIQNAVGAANDVNFSRCGFAYLNVPKRPVL